MSTCQDSLKAVGILRPGRYCFDFSVPLGSARQLDFFREMEAQPLDVGGSLMSVTMQAERPGVCDRLAMKLEWQAMRHELKPTGWLTGLESTKNIQSQKKLLDHKPVRLETFKPSIFTNCFIFWEAQSLSRTVRRGRRRMGMDTVVVGFARHRSCLFFCKQ